MTAGAVRPDGPVVAVVPAKGRSQRVPRKNLSPLAGCALFRHSVRVGRRVPTIDLVVVSSEDDEILDGARAEGARAMPRPPELAGDVARNFDVLVDLLATLRADGIDPAIVVLLQPTTPFRTPDPLGAMIDALAADPTADSLVTVTPATRPTGRIEDGRWVPDERPGPRVKAADGRQAITGHAFLIRPRATLDTGSLLGTRILAAPLPASWLDIDIDLPEDLFVAERVAADYFAS